MGSPILASPSSRHSSIIVCRTQERSSAQLLSRYAVSVRAKPHDPISQFRTGECSASRSNRSPKRVLCWSDCGIMWPHSIMAMSPTCHLVCVDSMIQVLQAPPLQRRSVTLSRAAHIESCPRLRTSECSCCSQSREEVSRSKTVREIQLQRTRLKRSNSMPR